MAKAHSMFRLFTALIVLFISIQYTLHAQQTIQDLVAENRLSVAASIDPQAEGIPTQKVTLSIQISTDRWFTGGTKLGVPEIANAIVLQRQKFAINRTQREEGKAWAIQTWEIEIFPREAGTYIVPQIDIEITISGDNGIPITGSVSTIPLSFTTQPPENAPGNDYWIATPSLTFTESWDNSIESLKTGDARQRTIRIEAQQLPAMMLPSLKGKPIEGLSAYPSPPKVSDNTSRGKSTAIREESVTYFFDKEGSFLLPQLEIHWWNTTLKQWEIAKLPEHKLDIQIDPESKYETNEERAALKLSPTLKPYLLFGSLSLAAAIVIWLWIYPRIRTRFKANPSAPTLEQRRRESWKSLKRALAKNDPHTIISALYPWLSLSFPSKNYTSLNDLSADTGNAELKQIMEELLANAYGSSPGPFAHSVQLKKMLARIHRKGSQKARLWKSEGGGIQSSKFKLN